MVIQPAHLVEALKRYSEDASDTLKAAFDKAFRMVRKRKYRNGRLILKALANLGENGGTQSDILYEIRQEEPRYPAGNLTSNLKQLQMADRGALVRYDSASGRYSLSDPVYLAFAQAVFADTERAPKESTTTYVQGSFPIAQQLVPYVNSWVTNWDLSGNNSFLIEFETPKTVRIHTEQELRDLTRAKKPSSRERPH